MAPRMIEKCKKGSPSARHILITEWFLYAMCLVAWFLFSINVYKNENTNHFRKFLMGAAILFQKSYVVSNGKPTLPPAIRRKHWPVWVFYNTREDKQEQRLIKIIIYAYFCLFSASNVIMSYGKFITRFTTGGLSVHAGQVMKISHPPVIQREILTQTTTCMCPFIRAYCNWLSCRLRAKTVPHIHFNFIFNKHIFIAGAMIINGVCNN